MLKSIIQKVLLILCIHLLVNAPMSAQEVQDGLGRVIGYIENGTVKGVNGYIRGYIDNGQIKNANGLIIGYIKNRKVTNADGEKLGFIGGKKVKDNNRNLIARVKHGEVRDLEGKVVGRFEGVAPTEAALFLYYFFRPPIHR